MKQIILISIAGLALLATAATAHQYNRGSRHGTGHGNMSGSCPMNSNMQGQHRGSGMAGNTATGPATDNWKVNPSYQGQVNPTTPAGQ